MTARTCALPSCGRIFEAERADARYCSPSCRGKASRERRRKAAPPPPPPPSISEPASPPPSDPPDDFASRVLSLEERLENLEADLDLAEARQSTLIGLASHIEALSRRLPSEDKVQDWCRDVIREEIDSIRERLDDLERAVGLDEEPTEGSLTNRMAALESTEPGSDQAARIRIRRLEDRLAREINHGKALEQQVAVLAVSLRDLAAVVG